MDQTIQLFFAGMWDMVWHYGLGIGLIILCVAGAFFSPLFKKDFLYAAVVIAVAMAFETMGVREEKVHCDAQQAVIEKTVTKVVAKTATPKAKTQKDKWDNSKY